MGMFNIHSPIVLAVNYKGWNSNRRQLILVDFLMEIIHKPPLRSLVFQQFVAIPVHLSL